MNETYEIIYMSPMLYWANKEVGAGNIAKRSQLGPMFGNFCHICGPSWLSLQALAMGVVLVLLTTEYLASSQG